MVNKRNLTVVLIFVLITFFVLINALSVHRKGESISGPLDVETIEQTKFKNIHYYSNKNSIPDTVFSAEILDIEGEAGSEKLFFTQSKGKVRSNEEWVEWSGKEGRFNTKTQELFLKGEVSVTAAAGTHKSDSVYYNGLKNFLEAKGQVFSRVVDLTTLDVLNITSNYVSAWISEKRTLFLGHVVGTLKRKRNYEGGLDFSAERMELNQLNSLLTLENNVKLDRNNYHLESQKGEIFLENFNKKLKYYVLYDDIKLVEKMQMPSGETQVRRAFAEKLEGHISQSKTVLSGAPRVEQGEDIIKGYQITLRENVEIVEVDDSQSSFRFKKED